MINEKKFILEEQSINLINAFMQYFLSREFSSWNMKFINVNTTSVQLVQWPIL